MKNDSSDEEHTAHVIPFTGQRHEVLPKSDNGSDKDIFENELINEILSDYYDHFEENSSFVDVSEKTKKSFNSEEFLVLHDKIEHLQNEIIDLEDKIRFHLNEIKTFLPAKK